MKVLLQIVSALFLFSVVILPPAYGAAGSCPAQSVGDNFSGVSYSQNSGSQNWIGNWTEVGESDGASAGIARVLNTLCTSGNCLRLGVPSGNRAQSYSDKGVYREIDLSGASSATLSFVYRKGVNLGSQTVVLSVYDGSSWTNLHSYFFNSTDTSPTSATFDLSAYTASNTRIRFLASGNNAVIGMYIDDVSISYQPTCTPIPLAEYRFDELSWDGTANEVIDSSGNNHNGSTIGGISTTTGKICNAAEIPSNNSETIFEAVDTGIDLDTLIGSNGTISLWYKANSAWNSGSDKRLFDATDGDKYFAADIKSNGKVKFYFEDGSDGDYQKTTVNSFSVGAGVWKHLTFIWDVTTNTAKIFVDGVEQTLSGGTGRTTAMTGFNTLYFGDNRSPSYFIGKSSASGLIDEALVFNSVLTSTQIQRIFTNQNAGNNYDSSARNCPTAVTPLAEYQFEETSWNGTAGEIIDNTGNGYHAQAIRDSILVNPAPATAPSAIPGDPGTCGYTSQASGSIQATGLPLDTTTVGVKTTVTFWMNWNNTNSVMPIGWYTHDIWITSGSMGFNTGNGDLYGISSAGLAHGWHHVAAEFTNGNITNNRIHIDGVEQVLTQRHNLPIDNRVFVNSEFRIGGWRVNTGYGFQGLMDEVRIYQGALSTTQINTIKNEVHPCNTPIIHHYEISHDGNGLTCAPEEVLIRACTDASCTSFDNTINTTVTMQVNGGSDQNITIVNGSSVNESFVYTDPDNPAVLSLTSDYSCSDTSDNSAGCAVNFAKAGFLLNLDNHQSCTTPKLTIKAVKLSNSGLDCAPAYTGNQSVDFIFNYSDPFNGTEVPSLNAVDMAAAVTQNKTVAFDSTGTAKLDFNYQDAGQIRINVSDAAAAGLTASSVTTVVTPAKLIVASPDANADCATSDAANATCSVFKAAGAPFKLDITAACSNNIVTKNFKMNNIPLSVTTIAPNIAPNVANLVTLGVTSIDVLEADHGIHETNNQTISEVGVFTITATPPRYFNEIIPAAVSANIGRFIPDHFDVSITHRSFEDTCTTGTSDFTYIGQPFTYLNAPELLITAKNLFGVTTKNYTEAGYQKLTATNIGRTFPMKDTSKDGTIVNTKMVVVAVTSDGNLTTPTPASAPRSNAGEMTYTFDLLDSFTYSKNANSEVGPFTSTYDIVIDSIEDSEGVNASTSLAFNVPSTNTVSPDGVNLRFGRVSLKNSFGPETSPIKQVLSVEYYDGTDFVLADTDTCTQYNSAKVSFGSINSVGLNSADIPAVSGAFIDIDDLPNGVTQQIVLPAVAAGNQGKVEVTYTIYPWLQYDWHWNGVEVKTFDENPSAIATFGLYRGNDRIIYSREVFD